MSNKKILTIVDTVSNEKGLAREDIFQALEAALANAARKQLKDDSKKADIRVVMDRKTGDYETFRRYTVVSNQDYEEEDYQIDEDTGREEGFEIGEVKEIQIENSDFSRIAAQSAKQVILQKIREAEKQEVAKLYQEKIGDIVTGMIKKQVRDGFIVDLGGTAEAILPFENTIMKERYRINDKVKALLAEINTQNRGPQLILSRTSKDFLEQLFSVEVPEISEDTVEIKASARLAGIRSKIAVKTNDGRIDPVGACVGMRGLRVQAITTELRNEKIDIIAWDDNPAQLVINAMSPAEVVQIIQDEDEMSMEIIVTEENKRQAIGRDGQNIKLASELTGWRLKVLSEAEYEEQEASENQNIVELLVRELGIEEEIATILAEVGISKLEELSYVGDTDLAEAAEIELEDAQELIQKAKNYLLNQNIAADLILKKVTLEPAFVEIVDNKVFAAGLVKKGIQTVADLAEQGTDDLLEIEGMTKELAEQFILAAREADGWFS